MIDPVTDCAIRQLHARYVDAVWRKDSTAFGQCWTADARWLIAGIDAPGRAAVVETFDALIAPSESVLMIPGALVLDETAQGIVGRVTVTELIRRPGMTMRTIGRYYDRYARENGVLCFASRHWHAAYRGATDLSDAMLPREEYGPPPAMPSA
ncbi:MAG: nuclear transport factor 2 family protein [Sphingomonadales bacterium]|nr:nuclear transport factor 2 family protein [Sphingomonadales bacterium]